MVFASHHHDNGSVAYSGCSLLLLGDSEVRRKRTLAPVQNTEEEGKDGGSPFVGEEDPEEAVFCEYSVYYSWTLIIRHPTLCPSVGP